MFVYKKAAIYIPSFSGLYTVNGTCCKRDIVIVKLKVDAKDGIVRPKDPGQYKKFRVLKGTVVSITDPYDPYKRFKHARSLGMGDAKRSHYRVGMVTRADYLTKDPYERCGHGIHVFATRAEAVAFPEC